MNNVQFIPDDKGAFVITEHGERVGEMIVGISGNYLSVYHTGVEKHNEGRGIGGKLVTAMAEYARQNNLKVMAFCPFVKKVFKEDPEHFADIWQQGEEFIKL